MFSCKTVLWVFLVLLPFVTITTSAYPVEGYSSLGKRDPFEPLLGRRSAGSVGLLHVYTIEDVSFEGVIMGPDGTPLALINGEMVRPGQTVGRLELISVADNEVLLEIQGRRHHLRLYD